MNKKGFTLIEVLIVLTMILILSSFFIPKLTSYQAKAKDTKAINTARQIYEATLTSYMDGNGRLNKDKLVEDINNFTMASIKSEDVSLENGNHRANILFKSDEKKYKIVINANANKYDVYYNNKNIFSNR